MASPNKEPKGQFRTLLDYLFKWQRAHYHLWNIKQSREGVTDALEKTRGRLSKSHPVADSNATTRARMEANARSWAENSRETMEIHYRNTISNIAPAIKGADQDGWEEAWTVATKWMFNRYKEKFNVEILDWAWKEITPFRKEPPRKASATATQSHDSPSPSSPINPSTTNSSGDPEISPKKTPSKTRNPTPKKTGTTPKGNKPKLQRRNPRKPLKNANSH